MKDDGIPLSLECLERFLPGDFSPEEVARAKTSFYKRLSLATHRVSGGAMQTLPKTGFYGFNWFNALYSPGVSAVSTAIRDDQDLSFELSSRGSTVGIVTDSTRVLGDGDCGPAGGMGVMEGKAFLMKYLGGVDAVPLCVDSRDAGGIPRVERLVEFVKAARPSFGAINLEDISQPNCFRALDELQSCDIPVWHDDAQGTACVTVAGMLNALEVAGKRIEDARFVLLGAGAANTATFRLLVAAGADPGRMVVADRHGPLHSGRADLTGDPAFYRQAEICRASNHGRVESTFEAFRGADAVVALSSPGPGTLPREWVRAMSKDAIVFACANPVPEIWPHEAKEAGALVVATGRGDFPNQVNNSLCFPGLLKGVLIARARAVSDGMALACARAIAERAKARGLSPDSIVPTMEDAGLFSEEAGVVAEKAAEEGLARRNIPRAEASAKAERDIARARASYRALLDAELVDRIDEGDLAAMLEEAVREARADTGAAR